MRNLRQRFGICEVTQARSIISNKVLAAFGQKRLLKYPVRNKRGVVYTELYAVVKNYFAYRRNNNVRELFFDFHLSSSSMFSSVKVGSTFCGLPKAPSDTSVSTLPSENTLKTVQMLAGSGLCTWT